MTPHHKRRPPHVHIPSPLSNTSKAPFRLKSWLHALFQSIALLIPEFLFQLHISALVVVLLPKKIAFLASDHDKGTKLALIYSVGALVAAIIGPLIGISIDNTGFRRLWILIGAIGDVTCIFLLGFTDYLSTVMTWFFVATFVTISAVAWSGWLSSQAGGKTASNVSRLAFFGFLGSAVGSQVGYIHNQKVAFAIVALVMGVGMFVSLLIGEEEDSSCLKDILEFVTPAKRRHGDKMRRSNSRLYLSPDSESLPTKSYNSMAPSDVGSSGGATPKPTLAVVNSAQGDIPPSPVSVPLSVGSMSAAVSPTLPPSPSPEAEALPFANVDIANEDDEDIAPLSEEDDTPTEKGSLTSLIVDMENPFMYMRRGYSSRVTKVTAFLRSTLYALIAPLWESSTYRYLVLGNFLMHMGIDSVLSFLLYFFRDVYFADEIHVHVLNLHLNASSAVAFLSPFIMGGSLASSVCFVLFPFISEFGSLWMVLSSGLMIVLPVSLIFSTSRWFLAICAMGMLYGLGQGIFICMNWVLAVRCVQQFEWKHSQTLGLWQSFSIIARLVSSTIGGFIIDRWIHVTLPWFGNNIPVSYFIVMLLSALYFVTGAVVMMRACRSDAPVERKGGKKALVEVDTV